jgi:N-acetylmuramoyl-L-alanine amidase
MRQAPRNKKDLRVVIDLKTNVHAKSFLLKPNADYGHRLVIDLYPESKQTSKKPAVVKKASNIAQNSKWVVAIDAGHGGEDPGAKGYRGTREKVVVLAIAKKLAALVNQQPNMKAYLVRSGDYYIGLRKRMEKARRARADLFISIHADAFRDQRARGSSVYVLSNRGASSEAARWLADSANAADLVGGVSLDDKDDMLASVLLDLSQNATEDASATVASEVLKNLKGVGHVHKKRVQRAGFMVLKSPDIPSILIETAFISNKKEEANLRSSRHQGKVAKAIMKGVKAYFANQQVPSTSTSRIAKSTYKIKRGDTLSAIAVRHRVSLSSLKKLNKMQTSRIRIGQVIRIPS